MAYPQKHKPATIDFFDKMQEKMQAEDSKRRKLNKKSTSSQPELMFLQFNPKQGQPCFGNKTQHMSQQAVSKKTWKPPTKVCSSEPETIDAEWQNNENQRFTNSSSKFVKDVTKINTTHASGNQIKNENDVSPQGDTNENSFMTIITESDSTKLRDQAKNVPVQDINACKKENDTLNCELSRSNSTMNDCDESNNLALERSNKMQFQCFVNYNECLSGQETTQQNLNLSKELDTSNSDDGTNYNCNGKKFYEDQNKEISDNEDTRLIKSIDLILSENQQSQHSQSESNSDNYDKNTHQKDKNGAVVEYQSTCNEMPDRFFKDEGKLTGCKTSVDMTTVHLETDINKEITTNITTSSNRSAEVTQLRLETDNNNEITSNALSKDKYSKTCKILMQCNDNDESETSMINYSTEHSTSSFHDNNNLLQSDGMQTYPVSSSCNKNHQKVNDDRPSRSSESYNRVKTSGMIHKAMKQVEINNYACRPEEYDSVDSRVRKETSQSVQDQRKDTEEVKKEGANKIVVGNNDEEHGPLGENEGEEVDTFIGEEKHEANTTVKVHSDEENFVGFKHEKNKTGDVECEGVDTIFDAKNDEVNKHVEDDENKVKDEIKQKFHGESDFYDEEKNGFDDDCSCLMISNSQLMELEKKYYEAPENVKSPVLSITTQPKNYMNHETSSVAVQRESGIRILPSNPSCLGLAPTAQWNKRFQETQEQLRETIKEVGRLNAILMKIRKELWPQRNMTGANKL